MSALSFFLAWLATMTLGPACPHGCGYRTRTRGHKSHVDFDHAGDRLVNACACGDCYHPALWDATRGEPYGMCQDCACPSRDHIRDANDDPLGPIFGPAADKQTERLRAALADEGSLAEWLGEKS